MARHAEDRKQKLEGLKAGRLGNWEVEKLGSREVASNLYPQTPNINTVLRAP
jgi:hypothetical protein